MDWEKYEDWRYGVDHVQTHLDAAVGVVSLGLGQSRHTVVAVPQDLNPATVVFLPKQQQQQKDFKSENSKSSPRSLHRIKVNL